jgi:hypothetical protein
MGISYFEVDKQFKKFQKTAITLNESLLNENYDEFSQSFPLVVSSTEKEIDELGKAVEELCREAFEGTDRENDPFYDFGYVSFSTGDSDREKRKRRRQRSKDKIDALQNFIKRKIEKTSLYINSEIYEKNDDEKIIKTSTSQISPTIGTAHNVYMADAINITNIINVLQQLEKEIENESNLTPQEKQELQKEVKEVSGKLHMIKNCLAKYGGKFTGHALRSFAGLPDDLDL